MSESTKISKLLDIELVRVSYKSDEIDIFIENYPLCDRRYGKSTALMLLITSIFSGTYIDNIFIKINCNQIGFVRLLRDLHTFFFLKHKKLSDMTEINGFQFPQYNRFNSSAKLQSQNKHKIPKNNIEIKRNLGHSARTISERDLFHEICYCGGLNKPETIMNNDLSLALFYISKLMINPEETIILPPTKTNLLKIIKEIIGLAEMKYFDIDEKFHTMVYRPFYTKDEIEKMMRMWELEKL